MTDTPETPDADKLVEIDQEIADVRHRLAEEAGEVGPHFDDVGTADRGQPVDDTIVPPG
jgi:hypothetical protein